MYLVVGRVGVVAALQKVEVAALGSQHRHEVHARTVEDIRHLAGDGKQGGR